MVNDYDAPEDEYYEEEYEADGLRWMSVIVVLFVVVGFFALAWYAYRAGTQQFNSDEVLLVKADDEPYKVEPEDKGGREFPNQDKTIYETIGDNKESGFKELVDKVEDPIVGRVIDSDKEEAQNNVAEDDVVTIGDEDIVAKVQKYEKEIAKEPKPKRFMEAAIVAKKVEKEKVEKEKVKSLKLKSSKLKVKKMVKQRDKVKNKKKVSDFGGYGVQVAALKSYADAQSYWKKLSKKYSSIIGGKPHKISKAVVKGITYYRVKIGGWGSEIAAKSGCKKLKARGQSCMVR